MTRSYIRYIRYPIELFILYLVIVFAYVIHAELNGYVISDDAIDSGKVDAACLGFAFGLQLLWYGFRDLMQGDVKQ